MRQKAKELLQLLSIPLILVAVYLFIRLVWGLLDLPPEGELLIIVREWFSRYGLWVVFISALVEGFLLLGQYFPGGVIIFLGVITAGKDIPRAIEVVLVVCLSFFIGYSLNYLVGKYGWYKLLGKFGLAGSIDASKEKIMKHGLSAVFLSYWDPNFASITATAAGILNVSFKKFSLYSAAGIIVWNTFWGTLVYTLGEAALKITGLKWVLIIFGTWIGVILVKEYVLRKKLSVQDQV